MTEKIARLADRAPRASARAAVEIVVVASEESAGRAGFREGSRRHGSDPTLVAWWPALGADPLRGLYIHRVTVIEPPDGLDAAQRDALGYLKRRCEGPWISA